jgi:hypothetical protein
MSLRYDTKLSEDSGRDGDFDEEKATSPRRAAHFGLPAITIQDDSNASPARERELRRTTSNGLSGPSRGDAASRIIGDFRSAPFSCLASRD